MDTFLGNIQDCKIIKNVTKIKNFCKIFCKKKMWKLA